MSNELIAGHEAGHFTLPPGLVEAARAVEPLQNALDEQQHAPTLVAEAKATFLADLLEAARAGRKLPSAAGLMTAKMVAETQDEVTTMLREELRQAERHARGTFSRLQSTILTDHLRPALEETIARARKAKAGEMRSLAGRYAIIRGARSSLDRIAAPSKDEYGLFAEFQDTDSWWPEFYPERSRARVQGMIQRSPKELKERQSQPPQQFTPPPWPADSVERFKWILENAQPWLPTGAEQDELFERYLSEARSQHAEASRRWREENWQTV